MLQYIRDKAIQKRELTAGERIEASRFDPSELRDAIDAHNSALEKVPYSEMDARSRNRYRTLFMSICRARTFGLR